MKEFVVRVQQTKDYIFTMAAEDELDAWENAKEAFYENDATEAGSELEVIWVGEKKDEDQSL